MKITGSVERIVFESDTSSFKVASISVDGDEYIISGNMPLLYEHGVYEFDVTETVHQKYGFQFSCNSFRIADKADEEDIVRFLCSGAFRGIGEKTAERIVDTFGTDTLDIIKNDISRLSEVQGIGKKSLAKIIESAKGHLERSDTLFALSKFGFSLAQAESLYSSFSDNAENVIRETPYEALRAVPSIGFNKIDEIALKNGIERNSIDRIAAIILHELNYYSTYSGDTYIAKNVLIRRVLSRERFVFESESVLNDSIDEALVRLVISGYIHIEQFEEEEDRIYLYSLYDCETLIAEELSRINAVNYDVKHTGNLKTDVLLSEDQEHALDIAFDEAVFVLTGAAGSGKTTILNELIKRVYLAGLSYRLAAPTGRAAARMTDLTGETASTIHRLLEVKFDEESNALFYGRDSKNPIEEEVLFIDEASMIDVVLFSRLLKAIKTGTKLVLIGDPNQLPPVGAGAPFLDIISSGVFNVGRLTGIHRQNNDSKIISNAHRVLKREELEYNADGGDFYLFKTSGDAASLKRVVELVYSRIPKKFGYDSMTSISVLSPKKKGLLGTENLNVHLQSVLNKNADFKFFEKYAKGDKVMQIKNNYNLSWTNLKNGEDSEGVFNGEIGTIVEASNQGIVVNYNEEKLVTYGRAEISELTLAYAMTVHKSQGNEFDVVVMPSYDMGSFMESNNLIYTAITRAKKMFVLVGNEFYFERAYQSENNNQRNTSLRERLSHDEED